MVQWESRVWGFREVVANVVAVWIWQRQWQCPQFSWGLVAIWRLGEVVIVVGLEFEAVVEVAKERGRQGDVQGWIWGWG